MLIPGPTLAWNGSLASQFFSWRTPGFEALLALWFERIGASMEAPHFLDNAGIQFQISGVIGWRMDRQMVLDHLALAEQHITEGKIIIERQLTLIAKLEQGGHDTTGSRELLTQFLHTQKMHEEDRKRLRRELAKLDAEKPRNSS